MPWYEYRCSICGEDFDEVTTIAERDNVTSPCCNDVFPKRLVSKGHFVMDGKMQTLHPNSPDGVQRIKEIKKKQWKKGKKNHDEWKKENIAKAKKDKVWSPVE
jgi:putative FmdB family regulatory protein